MMLLASLIKTLIIAVNTTKIKQREKKMKSSNEIQETIQWNFLGDFYDKF